MPLLKREGSTDQHLGMSIKGDKRSKTTVSSKKVDQEEITISSDPGMIEEKNRSLIKKLVHHQLLGKGLEKKDEDYLACFNPTCNGTVLALRQQIKSEAVEKTVAAGIIEKHLNMYL